MVSRLVCARLVLPVEKMSALAEKFYRWLIALGNTVRSPLLLAVRLFWGWQFFLTGKGKLTDLTKPTQFFESLGIPFPHAQAVLAGSVNASADCFCSRSGHAADFGSAYDPAYCRVSHRRHRSRSRHLQIRTNSSRRTNFFSCGRDRLRLGRVRFARCAHRQYFKRSAENGSR